MKVFVGFGNLTKSLLTFVKETEDLFVFSRNKSKIIEGKQLLKDLENNRGV